MIDDDYRIEISFDASPERARELLDAVAKLVYETFQVDGLVVMRAPQKEKEATDQ